MKYQKYSSIKCSLNIVQILYFTRSTHMEERQIEIPDFDLDEASDSESIKSPKMETVEVIKLHMTSDMPKGIFDAKF